MITSVRSDPRSHGDPGSLRLRSPLAVLAYVPFVALLGFGLFLPWSAAPVGWGLVGAVAVTANFAYWGLLVGTDVALVGDVIVWRALNRVRTVPVDRVRGFDRGPLGLKRIELANGADLLVESRRTDWDSWVRRVTDLTDPTD